MKEQDIFTLINQQDGNLAFKLLSFKDNSYFDHLQRNNFYSIIWIKDVNGLLKVDFSEYLFHENTLFAFSPYQPFMFSVDKSISGVAIQFHSDFYCIHRNPKETNCDAILFLIIFIEHRFFRLIKFVRKNLTVYWRNLNQSSRFRKMAIMNYSFQS